MSKSVATAGPSELEVRDTHPRTTQATAVVQLKMAGICGTDLKILDGSTPIEYPRILGHEMVGEVTEAAPGGKLGAGSKVMVNPGIYCGECHLCNRDRPHLCRQGGLRGRDFDGVFAEFLAVEERFLHAIPDGVAWDEAALLQVLGTVVHAQRTVQPSRETVAVVIGLGVSGMLHAQLLAGRGVGCVIGVTRSRWKLDLARQLGVHVAVTPEEAGAAVAEFSQGRGADLVIEAVGTESTVAAAIELCGSGGEVIIYGTVTGEGGRIPFYQLYFKEITLRNPRAALPRDYDHAIHLGATGQIQLAPLISARYPLERAEAAFAAARSGNNLKVLLTP